MRLLRARNNIGESSSGSSVTTAAACPVFTVRQATSDDELEACSLIRAAAYFEASHLMTSCSNVHLFAHALSAGLHACMHLCCC